MACSWDGGGGVALAAAASTTGPTTTTAAAHEARAVPSHRLPMGHRRIGTRLRRRREMRRARVATSGHRGRHRERHRGRHRERHRGRRRRRRRRRRRLLRRLLRRCAGRRRPRKVRGHLLRIIAAGKECLGGRGGRLLGLCGRVQLPLEVRHHASLLLQLALERRHVRAHATRVLALRLELRLSSLRGGGGGAARLVQSRPTVSRAFCLMNSAMREACWSRSAAIALLCSTC